MRRLPLGAEVAFAFAARGRLVHGRRVHRRGCRELGPARRRARRPLPDRRRCDAPRLGSRVRRSVGDRRPACLRLVLIPPRHPHEFPGLGKLHRPAGLPGGRRLDRPARRPREQARRRHRGGARRARTGAGRVAPGGDAGRRRRAGIPAVLGGSRGDRDSAGRRRHPDRPLRGRRGDRRGHPLDRTRLHRGLARTRQARGGERRSRGASTWSPRPDRRLRGHRPAGAVGARARDQLRGRGPDHRRGGPMGRDRRLGAQREGSPKTPRRG